jgi:hypothetical protein
MTKTEFDKRVKLNGGCDRIIDNWKIIDIHMIPEIIQEYHELDFYCNEKDEVILLRIRNRQNKKYQIVKSSIIDYWIAELPITIINDKTIIDVINVFKSMI